MKPEISVIPIATLGQERVMLVNAQQKELLASTTTTVLPVVVNISTGEVFQPQFTVAQYLKFGPWQEITDHNQAEQYLESVIAKLSWEVFEKLVQRPLQQTNSV